MTKEDACAAAGIQLEEAIRNWINTFYDEPGRTQLLRDAVVVVASHDLAGEVRSMDVIPVPSSSPEYIQVGLMVTAMTYLELQDEEDL